MDKILRGIVRFNSVMRNAFLSEVGEAAMRNKKPQTIFITCMDSRLDPPKMINARPGEAFVIRNPGNMVPHFTKLRSNEAGSVGAGLELACVMNGVANVVVCGHSDCKAVNAMYSQRDHRHVEGENCIDSPLKAWLSKYGQMTVDHFCNLFPEEEQQRSVKGERVLGEFPMNFGKKDFLCTLDPHNKFSIEDKLSQFHCLQQASHIVSYPMLKSHISSGEVKVRAMWFDIPNGDMYLFSPLKGHFLPVDESILDNLLKEVES